VPVPFKEESSVNEDRENRRKWILTGLAVLAAIVTLTLGTRDSDDAKVAAGGATTTATAETPPPTETTPVDDGTASGGGSTTVDASEVPLPAEIADDPIVKRLAKGRTLPFTAGPWQKEQWRDAVFSRLSAGAQARFDKVPYQDGFGIVIQ
jgi:hypothetical protein